MLAKCNRTCKVLELSCKIIIVKKCCVEVLQNSLRRLHFSSQDKFDQVCTTVRKLF